METINDIDNQDKERTTVRAIIVKRVSGEIFSTLLMYRKKKGREYYVTLWGGQEDNETDIETLEREITEESGMKVKVIRKLDEWKDDFWGVKENVKVYLTEYESWDIWPVFWPEKDRTNEDNIYRVEEIPLNEIANKEIAPEQIKEMLLDKERITP